MFGVRFGGFGFGDDIDSSVDCDSSFDVRVANGASP